MAKQTDEIPLTGGGRTAVVRRGNPSYDRLDHGAARSMRCCVICVKWILQVRPVLSEAASMNRAASF